MVKLRVLILVGVIVVLGLVVALQPNRTSSVSAADVASVAVSILPSSLGVDDAPEYVGSKKCKICHIVQYRSWEKLKHAKAFESLKPDQASEIKTQFGLDPSKDYSTDATCLACHTVGFGKPGGYAVPDPQDSKAVKRAKSLEGIGCEMCHGPGESYLKLHKEIMKSKRKYKHDEMFAAGMTPVEESTCLACHNTKNPTVDRESYTFNYHERLVDGVHEHKALTLCEDAHDTPKPSPPGSQGGS